MKINLTSLVLAALAGVSFALHAADLPQSGTNRINGTVRFTNADGDILARLGPPGNEGVSSFAIFASTDSPDPIQSVKSVNEADPLSNPYALTVAANDVPLTYHVFAVLTLDGLNEEYWTAPQIAAPLTSNSPPATVDLEECVALVELRYVDSAGQPVAAQGGRALVTETSTGFWRARYLVQPPGRTENFLVVPAGVEIEVTVEVDLGTDIYLDRITHAERHVMTLACDDKPVITITLPDAGALGRITGNANLVDVIELPTDGYQELLGRPVVKARGPSGNERYAALAAEFPDPDSSRSFALEGLVSSLPDQGWRVQAEMHFGDGQRFEYFITPALGAGDFNPGVEVVAGGTTDLGDTFVMNPARLAGTLTLTGPPEFGGHLSALRGVVRSSDFDDDMNGIPDYVGASGINGSYVIATGVDQLAPGATLSAAGGQATASFAGAFNPTNSTFEGDYEAVVGMPNDQTGVWKYDGLNFVLYHPGTNGGPFVNETLYITEDAPWQGPLAPGERALQNLSYGFAEVCLRIRSLAPFFYPRVINTYGYHTNYDGAGNVLSSYRALLGNASAPPYTADAATNEAIVTMYLPEGTYSLQPSLSVLDPEGGVSEVQLPSLTVSVVAQERYCVEECVQLVFTGPTCTANFGFLTQVDAFSCDSTLTNLSLTTRPLGFPSIRLGYSDIRILEPVGIPRAMLHTAHGLFPAFDGFPREYYSNLVITAEARDTRGRVVTRQIFAHYDFTPPVLACSNVTVVSENGVNALVNYDPASSDGILVCTPPSGSVFPVGTTPVTCSARDLCYNTNTCAFDVTVRATGGDCVLHIELTQLDPPAVTLTWDCGGTLWSAPSVDGPWSEVAGATSPYAPPADEPQRFFRVCVSGDCPSQ